MEFQKLSLDCINTLRPYFRDNQCRICDCTIGGTFIWRDYHNTEYAVEDDTLFLKVKYPELAFTPPRSNEPNKGSYERILEYCEENKIPPRLCSVSETILKFLLEIFPNSVARTDRDWSDYLYLSADMTGLEGRRFSGQRNHINRFLREHPKWSFERVTEGNLDEVRAFYEKYAREHLKDSLAYNEGDRKALEALDNLALYGLFGGALYIDGEVIGVSLGEIVDDTLFVHTEKANTDYHGSYPMLMNQFAKTFVTAETEYVNREEDDGVEGLRTSKLSYHPVELLSKYAVELIQ